jgi:hypothetical protein
LQEYKFHIFPYLWIKSYEYLKILGEVWAGRACAAANEEELTTCAKNLEAGSRKEGASTVQERGTRIVAAVTNRAPTNGWQPLVIPDQVSAGWSTIAGRPTAGDQLSLGGGGTTSGCPLATWCNQFVRGPPFF